MTALAVNREETRWSVTFANPPANVVDPETTLELQALVDELEHDPEVTVVVFGSAYPDHFLGRPHHEQRGAHGRDLRRRRRAATRLINRGGFA